MNRVTVAGAAIVAAALGVAASVMPGTAMAAAPAAAMAGPAKVVTARAATPSATAKQQATNNASEVDGGKYITVVTCQGVDSPPPVHLGGAAVPLTVSGTGSSSTLFTMLKQADPYKKVYTCSVVVEERVPAPHASTAARCAPQPGGGKNMAGHKRKAAAGCVVPCETGAGRPMRGGRERPGQAFAQCKAVTLNTGFGGKAALVRAHHPAG